MPSVTAAGHRLDYLRISPGGEAGADRSTLVFLHEGLGSVEMWRDFPARAAAATGCEAVVYSRWGYGKSEPLSGDRGVGYMHDEGLEALPEVLDALGVRRPILVGHSDGGSIALICAGTRRRPVAGLFLLAAHLIVEDITVASIAAARVAYQTTDLREKLARYHADVDSAFWGWNRIWLHPDFRRWNIEGLVRGVDCPVLALQGEDDEYGTPDQLARISALVKGAETRLVPRCRHSPHRDQPDLVLEALAGFVRRAI